jgi:hypothetical protein
MTAVRRQHPHNWIKPFVYFTDRSFSSGLRISTRTTGAIHDQ